MKIKPLWIIGLGIMVSCNKGPLSRSKASFIQLPSPELGEEWSATQESQAEAILSITKDIINKRASEDRLYSRDAHPKSHGCVKAVLEIQSDKLPSSQRVGVFSENKKFDSWVRFSNGDPDSRQKPDSDLDVRGMALKIMNVPGSSSGSQDMLMITSKEFFSKDGDDYLELFNALTKSKANLAWYALTHPLSAKRLFSARVQIANPLEANYFSSVPYKLGNRSMRFKSEPCELGKDSLPQNPGKTYLQEKLVSSLSQKSYCFKISVQPNMEPDRNPVEDPRQIWDEKKSPYFQVATLTIPVQSEISSKRMMNFCENLSMDPWHTHPQMRPLGQINRMRALIYGEISKVRHDLNRTKVMEPTNLTPCQGQSAPLCDDPHH